MNRITSCFIRKNTPELRKKLEGLGWKWCISEEERIKGDIINCYAYLEGGNIASYDSKIMPERWLIDNFNTIDCGTNETLFLALAAMRDDTDYMQWFVCDEHLERQIFGYWHSFNVGQFVVKEKIPIEIIKKFHKATKEEIVQHFKDK